MLSIISVVITLLIIFLVIVIIITLLYTRHKLCFKGETTINTNLIRNIILSI